MLRKTAFIAFVTAAGAGCGTTPDLTSWRGSQTVALPEAKRPPIATDIRRVAKLRAELDLAASRKLALRLAAESPGNPTVLLLASRAESDGVFLFSRDEQEKRDLSALSSLDFAGRAVGGSSLPSSEMLAQYAWTLGTTTHLQPMFDRAAHANRTLEICNKTLDSDPDNTVALATLATLRLRLATLPWIAKVMASSAPEGDLDEAEKLASRCVELTPSVEYRLLLAKTLIAAEKTAEALTVLEAAIAAPARYPRDRELAETARSLANELDQALRPKAP